MAYKHTRIASAERWYRETLGIHVGDLLTKGTPPERFEVWDISIPRMKTAYPGVLVIRTWPVVDVSLVRTGQEPAWERDYPFSGISNIRQVGTHWANDLQEEFTFCPPDAPRPFPVHPTWSFPPMPNPYAFQQEVDYRAGWRKVWHCPRCLRDWNDLKDHRSWEYATCAVCGMVGDCIVLMEDPQARQSAEVLAMNA
jgi:hypothetical protein